MNCSTLSIKNNSQTCTEICECNISKFSYKFDFFNTFQLKSYQLFIEEIKAGETFSKRSRNFPETLFNTKTAGLYFFLVICTFQMVRLYLWKVQPNFLSSFELLKGSVVLLKGTTEAFNLNCTYHLFRLYFFKGTTEILDLYLFK